MLDLLSISHLPFSAAPSSHFEFCFSVSSGSELSFKKNIKEVMAAPGNGISTPSQECWVLQKPSVLSYAIKFHP
jgi:hypothetical protein